MKEQPFVYRKIVAAVTFRENSVHPAMLRSVSLSRSGQREVALVHASDRKSSQMDSIAQRFYGEFRSAYPEITSTCLKSGSIWNAIFESARGMEADLVAIGSHIHNQVAALVGVGNSSDWVMRRADRDVLITRTERYHSDKIPENYKHVMLAINLRDNHQQALERAVGLALNQGARLSIVYVMEYYPVDRENEDIAPEDKDPVAHLNQVKRKKLEQLANETGLPGVGHEVLVSTSSACEVIAGHAGKIGADLIVIGSRKLSAFNLLFGSNADCVAHHAPCDVLIIHHNT